MTIDRNFNAVFENRVDYPFWQGLEQDELRIQRCSGCRRWMWPAEWRCGECGSWDFDWETIAPEGTIYAWERTHQPFVPQFADMLPYVNALVELPQAGNRHILGLVLPPHEGIRIGARVTAAIQPPGERTHGLPALWWRLAETGEAAR